MFTIPASSAKHIISYSDGKIESRDPKPTPKPLEDQASELDYQAGGLFWFVDLSPDAKPMWQRKSPKPTSSSGIWKLSFSSALGKFQDKGILISFLSRNLASATSCHFSPQSVGGSGCVEVIHCVGASFICSRNEIFSSKFKGPLDELHHRKVCFCTK